MAEWLRRLTRNQMGSSRVGWNPADCVNVVSQVIQKANVEQGLLELAITSCLPRSICFLAMLQRLDTTISDIYLQFSPQTVCAVMAEWLRSLTRNQMKSFRYG